jgi:hypothetical protein
MKILSILLLLVSNLSFAQETLLMLQKKNKNRNAYYKEGDEISFRLKESQRKTSGQILGFRDSVIVFHGFEVRVDEISSLYIDEKTKWWLRYKIEQVGLIAGVGYLALDYINSGQITKETLVICGGLIGVGLVGKILIGNRIKIRGRTKLRILNFNS